MKSNVPENLGLWNREREMFASGIRSRSVIKLKESANDWNRESKFHWQEIQDLLRGNQNPRVASHADVLWASSRVTAPFVG